MPPTVRLPRGVSLVSYPLGYQSPSERCNSRAAPPERAGAQDTEIFSEIDVAANFVVFAVLSVNVQVVFFVGVTRYLPEMRHVPVSDHLRVPVDTGSTNEVSATFRDRFAATDFTVKPEYARTVVAVALLELLFEPTTETS